MGSVKVSVDRSEERRVVGRLERAAAITPAYLRGALHAIALDLRPKSIAVAPFRVKEPDSEWPWHLRETWFSEISTNELVMGYQGLPYIIPQHEGGWINLHAW